jgi:hypothetical protein
MGFVRRTLALSRGLKDLARATAQRKDAKWPRLSCSTTRTD